MVSSPQTAELGGQGVRQRGEAALPGAAAGKRALLGQAGAQQLHLWRGLLQHGKQVVDGMQLADDHDHQGFHEQPIGVELGPAAPTLGGRWGRRQAIDQSNQHDKQRALSYHSGASVSCLVWQPHMMWGGPRVGQVTTRPFDL